MVKNPNWLIIHREVSGQTGWYLLSPYLNAHSPWMYIVDAVDAKTDGSNVKNHPQRFLPPKKRDMFLILGN